MTISDPRALRTRRTVVEAAVSLLGRGGRSELTHVNLARESGLGRSTLYRHWPTTTDLVLDLLETFRMPDFEPVDGPLRARLEHNLRRQMERLFDREYVAVYQLIQDVALEPRVRSRLVEINRDRIASVAAVLAPEHDLADDPAAVTEVLALLNGPLLQMATFVGAPSAALLDAVLDSVLAYLAAQTSRRAGVRSGDHRP